MCRDTKRNSLINSNYDLKIIKDLQNINTLLIIDMPFYVSYRMFGRHCNERNSNKFISLTDFKDVDPDCRMCLLELRENGVVLSGHQ